MASFVWCLIQFSWASIIFKNTCTVSSTVHVSEIKCFWMDFSATFSTAFHINYFWWKNYILGNGFLISSWLLMGFYQFWTQTLLKQNLVIYLPFSIKSIYLLLMPSNSKTEVYFLFLVREDWAKAIWVWDFFLT